MAVLLQSDTGVGKDVVARAIHFESQRRDKHLVAVNCSLLSETLLESRLIGYRTADFTGAVADKRGLFEAAWGGTIFLGEIADTPSLSQGRLLRVPERGEFTPLAATLLRPGLSPACEVTPRRPGGALCAEAGAYFRVEPVREFDAADSLVEIGRAHPEAFGQRRL